MKSRTINTAMTVITGLAIGLTIVIKAIPNWTTYAAPPVSEAVYDLETELSVESVEVLVTAEKEPQKATEIVTEPPTEEHTTVYTYYDFIPLDEQLQSEIHRLCDKYEIAYDLMLAIAKTESQFTPKESATGDYGVWQINKATWESTAISLGLSDYKSDTLQNCEMSLYVLSLALEEAAGDLKVALNYYNSGAPGEVKYSDGTSYSSRVFESYTWINEQKGL